MDGDPVTQQQFAETMRQDKKEVLDAISTVNGHVQDTRVAVGEISVRLNAHEQRMDAQDKQIENQKVWNRGLASVEIVLAGVLAALGLREQ